MARFVKKLGQQTLRYQFDLELHEISMNIPYTVGLQVVWKKDQKRVESKNHPLIGGKEVTKASFNGEVLSMISTIARGKDGNYVDKTSFVVLKIQKGEKSRSVGQITLNLSNFTESSPITKFCIEKCPDKNAYLEMAVKSKLINTVTASETMSMMSGFDNLDNMSIDSTPDSEYNFNDMEETKEEIMKDLDQENIGIESKRAVTQFRKRIISSARQRGKQLGSQQELSSSAA